MAVAIIPARIGSKGLPLKNIQKLMGVPLISWTTKYAECQNAVEEIVLSTDSNVIIEADQLFQNFSKAFENMKEGELLKVDTKLILHRRRRRDSTDKAQTKAVILDVLKKLNPDRNYPIVLMQPTSPFRGLGELTEILQLVESSKSSVLSASSIFSPHPFKTFSVRNSGHISPLRYFSDLETPRQLLPNLYAADGSFYCFESHKFLSHQSIISQDTCAFIRPDHFNINIDSLKDITYAHWVYENDILLRNSLSWMQI